MTVDSGIQTHVYMIHELSNANRIRTCTQFTKWELTNIEEQWNGEIKRGAGGGR